MLDIIKSNTDISLVFKHGKRIGHLPTTALVLKTEEQHGQRGRVAFVAGKKNGNAVWRNRAKRRMRAACREIGGPWNGYDVVFVAGRSLNDVPYSKLIDNYTKAFQQIGLL